MAAPVAAPSNVNATINTRVSLPTRVRKAPITYARILLIVIRQASELGTTGNRRFYSQLKQISDKFSERDIVESDGAYNAPSSNWNIYSACFCVAMSFGS